MKIVSLEWKDAFCNGSWFDKEELAKMVENKELWCYTTGFLIKNTPKELIICSNWVPENKDHFVIEKFSNIQKIPKTWIRNYRVIGNTEDRKRKK